MDFFDILISASFWTAAIRIASPLIFATLGELICERAGVLNLGIEGIMVAGAFAGWMAVYSGTDLWTGVAVAMAVVAMVEGAWVVVMRAVVRAVKAEAVWAVGPWAVGARVVGVKVGEEMAEVTVE